MALVGFGLSGEPALVLHLPSGSMPSPYGSRDSPRTLHGRRRVPRAQLTRTGSIFGTIKNLVTAPLAWLTSYDDQENVSGKRGRNTNVPLEEEGTYHEDQPSAKRKRVESPQPSPPPRQSTRTTQGYLDVPENLLSRNAGGHHRHGPPVAHGRSTSLVTSLNIPPPSGTHPARRTASPAVMTSYMPPSMAQRTQSMDPPAYRAISLSRDVSMEDGQSGSVGRDVTMSPTRHTPFQLRPRNSLTPQPSGQTFGPTPRQKERDVSEPPPLAALITKPVFVKPPPQMTHNQAEQPVTTLGSLAETKGRIVCAVRPSSALSDGNHFQQSRSPMRQHSGLFLGARPEAVGDNSSTCMSIPFAPLWHHGLTGTHVAFVMPMNAAEKALHDLDVYKTPLLPSRLRGAQTIPEMFKPKKVHAPVLMRSDRDRERKPRLGMSEKKSKKEEEAAVAAKPYAGRGGLKKMLARRKLEEEEEREKERANAIETDQDEVADESVELTEPSKEVPEVSRIPSPPPVLAPPARPVGGREQSSLRVGRTRISRNHIARPISKSKNKFSAAFDDDEGEDAMLDEAHEKAAAEEPKKLPTLFEIPKGFSFAPDVSGSISYQGRISSDSPVDFVAIQKAPIMHDSSNAKEPPIAALPFSLTKPAVPSPPPAPAPAQPFFGESSKASAPALPDAPTSPKKPEVPVAASSAPLFPPVPSISLVPPSPTPAKPAESTSSPAASSSTPSSSIPNFFANSSIFAKPGVNIAPPAVTTPAPEPPKVENKAAPMPSIFSGTQSSTSAPKEQASQAEAAKPTPEPAPSAPFSFGNPASAPSAQTSTSSAPSPFSFASSKESASVQPANSFFAATAVKEAAPVTGETKPPAAASTLFGVGSKPAEVSTAPSTLPFTFGTPASSAAPSTAAPVAVPAASPFTFGQPKAEPAKAPENKPLFATAEPAKPSLFGAPAPSPSPFGGSQGSAGADAPKPAFTFGQPTPSPSTPAPTIEAPKPLFPSTSTGGTGGFSFSSNAPTPSPATPKAPFSFGVAPSTPSVSTPVDNKPAFTFGAPSTPAVSAPTTLFGGPSTGSNGADVSKPFSFGAPAPARPLTPPQKEQEMRMEESPTRGGGMDMNGDPPKPTNGFSFGVPSASSPFGQPSQPTASPFAFGVKTEPPKVDTKPTGSFASFGQSATTSAFSFGQKPAESTQSPISSTPFGVSSPFGQTPTSTAPAFSFGAPSNTNGGFGHPSAAANSQPASPSTFGQPAAPFAFNATPTSVTAPSNPFAFGSQPASPATVNAGLPQPPGSSGGFTFGAPSPATSQAPSSPFGAAPSLPTPGGSVGFTIGSAAPQPQAQAGGARQIKKLPTRRGGRR